MRPRTFWISSLGAALVFAGLTAWFPFTALGIAAEEDRPRVVLLVLWTSGVMAICFGATGLLTAIVPLGFRDVNEAGSVSAALQARRESRASQDGSAYYNFAGWTVTTGAFLIFVYFIAWMATGR